MSPTWRWVLLASFILKAGLALFLADLLPHYDERQFLRLAHEWMATGEMANAWRAPGYVAFMGLGLWVGDGHAVGIRLLQALLSTGTAFLVYRIGRREWGERAGFWAGAFVAFYPTQVAFSHLLWAETLFTTLVVLAFERLLALDRHGRLGSAVVAALALAAAALTRSTALGLLVVSVVWLARRRGEAMGLRSATVVGLTAVVAVACWSVPASLRAGCLVVVDLNGPFNLWSGNNAGIPDGLPGLWGVGLHPDVPLDPRLSEHLPGAAWRSELPHRLAADGVEDRFGCDGSRWFQEHALADIAARPGAFLARIPLKLASFWSPDFFPVRHLVRDWYGDLPPWIVALGLFSVVLLSCVPLLGGPVSLAVLRAAPFRSLALSWVLFYLAVHVVVFGVSRMHFPLVPILVLAVAGAFLDPNRRRDSGTTRRLLSRGLPWAAVILASWIFVAPLWVGLYLQPTPRHAGLVRALGGLRHLPVPGTHYVAWNLAGVEASLGNEPRALRVLEEEGTSERPFSRYLHARFAPSPEESEARLRRIAAEGDALFAVYITLAQQSLARDDVAQAVVDLRGAQERRPWDAQVARVIRTLEARGQGEASTTEP